MENARPSNWAREHIPEQMLVAANARAVGSVKDGAFAPSSDATPAGKFAELVDYLGRKNFCYVGAQVEPAIADLASRVQADGLDREQIVKLIRAQIFRGVTAHELGHTFGLRHNFEGSADAMNYFPQYWGVGADALPEGKAHLLGAGRTDSYEVQYSSIMDYHQRFNGDFAGLGLYDKAAIKLGYAETVEVFDEDQGAFVARDWITQQLATAGFAWIANFEWGFRALSNSRRPVNTPADVQGMKLRVPPELAIKAAFEALGANTQTIAFQEVYLALANKTVDGQDNPIGTTFAAKFFEVQSHIALTRHIYASIMLAANPRAWQNKLDAAQRRIVSEEALTAGAAARKGVRDREEEQIATMQKAGVAITRPDVAPFRDKMAPAYDALRKSLGDDTWNAWTKLVAAART
jgi:hypothetical protein